MHLLSGVGMRAADICTLPPAHPSALVKCIERHNKDHYIEIRVTSSNTVTFL